MVGFVPILVGPVLPEKALASGGGVLQIPPKCGNADVQLRG
jgi:hypothetical protein